MSHPPSIDPQPEPDHGFVFACLLGPLAPPPPDKKTASQLPQPTRSQLPACCHQSTGDSLVDLGQLCLHRRVDSEAWIAQGRKPDL